MTVIVDSNVWIFAEVKDAPEHPHAVRGIQSLLGKGDIGTNVVILSEVFHKISVLFGPTLASERVCTALLHPSVQWLDFGRNIAAPATRLAQETGIRINDALIAQQALEYKAPLLTDNVKDFKRVRGLKVIALR